MRRTVHPFLKEQIKKIKNLNLLHKLLNLKENPEAKGNIIYLYLLAQQVVRENLPIIQELTPVMCKSRRYLNLSN